MLIWALILSLIGALMSFEVKFVGDLRIGELLIPVFALSLLIFKGSGPRFEARGFLLFLFLGALMFIGYLISDLVADTTPAQYLRGWARVALFLFDCLALMIVVSHRERMLWWFVIGLAIGAIADLTLADVAITKWKTGYAEPIGLLVAALSGLIPLTSVGALLLFAFGLACIGLDYRSFGAVFSVAGGASFAFGRQRTARVAVIATGVVALAAVIFAVSLTESEYADRRRESNIGRASVIRIAWEAIVDSPLLGYGSWAADKRYLQRLRRASEQASAELGKKTRFGASMLPHSQLLQGWIEGGILAAFFFMVYGVLLARSLWRMTRGNVDPRMRGLYLVILLLGCWNLVASLFLGVHRLYIAMAVAVIYVLAKREQKPASSAAAVARARRPMAARAEVKRPVRPGAGTRNDQAAVLADARLQVQRQPTLRARATRR